MIPVLYEHDATSFATLGIGSLSECTSCEATEERNGRYELTLKYPMDGHLFAELKEERIVRAKANDSQRGVQAFRIYRISKPMNGTVTVYAQHISYDLAAIAVKPFSLTSRTPYQVMQALIAASLTTNPFSCYSDVSNQIDLSSETPLSIRAALGAEENSMLSQVDGEFEWDNLTVRFLASRGSDSGVTVEYGKNMTKLNSEGDTTSAYTHLMPFATYEDASGVSHTVTLTEGVLAIPTTLSGKKTLIHDFSDEFKEETTKDEAALRRIAQAYLAENPLGVAVPTTTVSFEPLWKSAGGPEEKINLCDTLTVRFPKLGVDAKAKVVKVVYDCLLEKPKSVTIGELKANLVDSIQEIEKEAKKTSAAVRDVPTEIQRKIDEATAQITGANGGCVVLRRHADGTPYELLIMDDEDISEAQGVWRWNIGGLGYSSTGYSGPYSTAITASGSIVADFITAGSLTADVITAGTIQSFDGSSSWNIETGDLSLTGEINATSGTFANVTIEDSCTIYGNLWMEGTFQTQYYSGEPIQYEFESRVGGEGIEAAFDKTDRNSHVTHSHGYITPVAVVTVPDDPSDMDDEIELGIAQDKSMRPGRLFNGVSFAHRASGSGSAFRSKDSTYLYADGESIVTFDGTRQGSGSSQTRNGQCWWGSQYVANHMVGDWYAGTDVYSKLTTVWITPDDIAYGSFQGRWYFGERTNVEPTDVGLGDGCTRAVLYGAWYVAGSHVYGTSRTWYQIEVTDYKMAFKYGSSELGAIRPNYQGYVDIQGTWKTNGNNWISSSDEKAKNSVSDLDERHSALFDGLRPRSFRYNCGTSGRKHTGFVVQEVLKAMEAAGISDDEYGLCCAFGDKGDPKTEWGLRYEELIALCVKEIQALKLEVRKLKEEKE